MEPTHFTLTPTLAAFIKAAKISGLNPYKYLAEYNIDPKKANTNERNLPVSDLVKVLNSACNDLGSYSFVLTVVNLYEWFNIDPKVLALTQQENLYTLTLVFNALIREQGSGLEFELIQQGKTASFRMKLPKFSNATPFSLAVIVLWNDVMTKVLGSKWQPTKFLICETSNKKLAAGFNINTLPVYFDQPHNAIEFDSKILFEKLSMKVSKNQELIKTYSNILNKVPTDSLTESVIKMVIYSGNVSIENVAKILGTSPRILQQKLKNLNTSFSIILNTSRMAIAKDLLQASTFKIAEIANTLAFNSPEAFIRFFKKHETVTPLYWRKTHY